MKFSLIVCTYMRPKALLILLKSVKEQTLYPNEILIIDGSTNEETKQILLKNKFKNLSYYKVDEKNRGLTRQRNFGVRKVSAGLDIVCFLDDDTVLESNYFKHLINTYLIHPNALAVGGYITNEIHWEKHGDVYEKDFFLDGWKRKEGSRFLLRKKIGLLDKTAPGWMPKFSHGRSVSFLPPSNKIYKVEQIMGGVASYKKEVFKTMSFSKYFEGYGLYEDADFSLRLAKKGDLYINTKARLGHYHAEGGRPNKYKYGKMVIRNGWYVWRVKYPKPNFQSRFKWNVIALVLTLIRATNIISTKNKKEAFTETIGRIVGWFSLILNKPKLF